MNTFLSETYIFFLYISTTIPKGLLNLNSFLIILLTNPLQYFITTKLI